MQLRTATSRLATPKRQTVMVNKATKTAANQARARAAATTARPMLVVELPSPTTANPMRAVMVRGVTVIGSALPMTMIVAASPSGMIRISGL